jgi:peptidyl-prolyl cis-trans isomerase D
MSIIQTIREKGARIAVIAIAVSLVAFILMDAFTGRSRLFGGNSTTLGVVNGKKIDYTTFQKEYAAEEDYQQQQGYTMDDRGRQQLNESLWNREVSKILLDDEFEKLGITVGKNEINDILFGKNPPQDMKQRFTDPKTNTYDEAAAKQFITQWKRSTVASDRQQLNSYITNLEYNRMMEKYTSLIVNSVNVPKWYVEKQNAENSQLAKISYVKVPYSTIADSSVKVSDEEIAAYINKHKDQFKQDEETRNIEYVLFNAGPNAADSAAVREKLESLKAEFGSTKDMEAFLGKNGTDAPFYDGHISKAAIKQPLKDSILKTPVGGIYGPYLDADHYAMAKMMDIQQWPDTVKVRHILIATQQQNQQGQWIPVRDDSTAKHLADSIQTAIRNGANFDSLCVKFSDDPGSKDKGGVYENIPTGQMVAPFNDFIFGHKTGDKGVVKTDFGYHYIEILSQKGSDPAYKIAYLTKPIYASSSTDDSVSNKASQFAGDSRDRKTFDENFEKNLKTKGLNKFLATDIRPNDFSISPTVVSRQLVKAIFAADKGDVLQPFLAGSNYVVCTVTEINKPGVQSVAKARPFVETILSKKKKAGQIMQKMGKINTLEAVSTAMNQPVQLLDSLRMNGSASFGYEPRVIGATFNPANTGKVVPEPIEGTDGVFALRVDNVSATPVENANIDDQRIQLAQGLQQRMAYPIQVLMKAATIKDNRAKFY